MAESTEILREYLVRLGYETDVASLRRFEDGLNAAGKRVVKVGAGIAAIVATTTAAATAFSYNMRRMYFSSQLANSSVKNLKAMQFASEQVGVSSDEMANAVQGMGQVFNVSPWMKSLVRMEGVATEGRKTDEIMRDYIGALRKKYPEWLAIQKAGQLGIPADTYIMLSRNLDDFIAKQEAAQKAYKEFGYDPDANEKLILEYTGMLDTLDMKFEVLGGSILTKLVEPTKDLVEWTDTWITKLTNFITSGALDKFWNNYLDRAEEYVFNPVEKVIEFSQKPLEEKNKIVDEWATTPIIDDNDIKAAKKWFTTPIDFGKDADEEITNVGKKAASMADQAMSFLMNFGMSSAQAAGVTARLAQESSLNEKSVRTDKKGVDFAVGLAQWSPERQKDYEELTGKKLKDASFHEQLRFLLHELSAKGKEKQAGFALAEAETPEESLRTFIDKFERPKEPNIHIEKQMNMAKDLYKRYVPKEEKPAIAKPTENKITNLYSKEEKTAISKPVENKITNLYSKEYKPTIAKPKENNIIGLYSKEKQQPQFVPGGPLDENNAPSLKALSDTRLGSQNNTNNNIVHQTTTIHVSGTQPEATAKLVAREQSRVNGDIIRNMKGAVQ